MNPLALIRNYYPRGTRSHRLLLRHSEAVAALAVAAARRVIDEPVDLAFVEQAALLHDIGIFATAAAELGCYGHLPYLCHGLVGRQVLEQEGLPRHALVCERHIGIGLSAEEITAQHLPLPAREMRPLSLEEKIVTYADLFFSKNAREADRQRNPDKVRRILARYGEEKIAVFDAWHARFGG